MHFVFVCALLVPSVFPPASSAFSTRVLGVTTRVVVARDDRASIRVHGMGIDQEGVAWLVDGGLTFDEPFQHFLSSYRVRIEGLVEHTCKHIVIRVRIPVWGQLHVRLLREV